MYLDVSVNRRYTCLAESTKGLKRIEVVDFLQFQDLSTLPVGISIISIKHNFLLVVTRNLNPKLDLYFFPVLLSLGILEKVFHILGVIDEETELLPPSLIHKVIFFCILG